MRFATIATTVSLALTVSAVPLEKRQTTVATTYAYLNQPCGPTVGIKAYPGTGDITKSGLCCSSWNLAGVTDDHCYISNGCQPLWGRCVNSTKLPAAPVVHTSCTKPGVIALTFDDGPSVLTSSLLDYLKTVGIKATFFLNGLDWKASTYGLPLPGIYALADVVKRAYAEGHQICSHTWSHTDMLTVNQVRPLDRYLMCTLLTNHFV